MTNYLKYLLIFSLFLAMGCKNPEPEVPEFPPIITVSGQNPLKTGIYMDFVDDSVKFSDRFGIDRFEMTDNVDTSLLGYYKVFYFTQSLSGMTAEAQRDVWTVVKPESMKGEWDVAWKILPSEDLPSFIDSLSVVGKKLIINNLNNVPELNIELSLAANLQDSVYIFEQYSSDSLYYIFGSGTIDERAMSMILNYSIVEESDTTRYQATYSRETISTK